MSSEPNRPLPGLDKRDLVVAGLGVAGVVVSWLYFAESTFAHGFVQSWVDAFTGHPFSTGLHVDLVFSLWIVIAMAVFDRRRIGLRMMTLAIAAGCILGVCAALPVYWIGLARARRREASRTPA